MLRFINKRIERSIGASDLQRLHREELLAEQTRTIAQMAPGIAFAGFSIMTMMLYFSYGSLIFFQVALWALCASTVQLAALYRWWKLEKQPKQQRLPLGVLSHTCAQAAMYGMLWAILPAFTITSADFDMHFAAFIAMTGILCGSGFALAVIPQAVLSFMIPIYMGLVISLTFMPSRFDIFPVAFILCVFSTVIPLFAVRYAKNLVQHVSTEIAMREQKNIVGVLLNEYEENGSDWLWEFDSTHKIQHASQRFLNACSIDSEVIRELDFTELLKELSIEKTRVDTLFTKISNWEAFRDIELVMNINGHKEWWVLTGKPNFDEEGDYQGYVGIGSNITSDKLTENKINLLAHSDTLTGLLNRAKFNDELQASVSQLERDGTPFCVMYLDLDRFKLINDTRGHLVGDQILKDVAKRISNTVGHMDIVARLGGDEFAVIMRENNSAHSAAKLAARLIEAVQKPFEIDGERHKIGISIGISQAPLNGTQPTQLLQNADLALYRSKEDGRGVFRFFERHMDADQREKRLLESELKEALDSNEFELYFQPLVSAEDGKPTGMEALIRWNHPIRGIVSPTEFIPIAEQSSLIQEIGNWTIREACKAAADWPMDVIVAVNLSVHHFNGSDIVSYTKNALEESGLEPHRLELEITESLLINNTDEVYKILEQLKALGVAIALDDFGTGYSSLSYILRFPFDKIKIDRSFITASSNDEAAKAILKMISTLGESLNIRITAEGVETVEQVEFLRSINCHQFQGFYFAKPLPKSDLKEFFASYTTGSETSEPDKEARKDVA